MVEDPGDTSKKTLLFARLEQLREELTSLKREGYELASMELAICKEMLEKRDEAYKIKLVIGDETKEDLDLETVKKLIQDKGLKARVQEVLQRDLKDTKKCWTDCTICVRCSSVCMSGCVAGCTICLEGCVADVSGALHPSRIY